MWILHRSYVVAVCLLLGLTALSHMLLTCNNAVSVASAQDVDSAPQPKKKGSADEKTVRALIAKLGDDSFEKRESAQQKLIAMASRPVALLRQIAKASTD